MTEIQQPTAVVVEDEGKLDDQDRGNAGIAVVMVILPVSVPPPRCTGKRAASCAVSQTQEDDRQAHVSVIIPTLSVCSGRDCMLKGLVNGVSANIFVDILLS